MVHMKGFGHASGMMTTMTMTAGTTGIHVGIDLSITVRKPGPYSALPHAVTLSLFIFALWCLSPTRFRLSTVLGCHRTVSWTFLQRSSWFRRTLYACPCMDQSSRPAHVILVLS